MCPPGITIGAPTTTRLASSSSSSSEPAAWTPPGAADETRKPSVLERMSGRLPDGQSKFWHDECARRRDALMNMVSPGTVVLVPAAALNHVPGTRIPLPYRQEATFFFLTGVYKDSEMVAALECR